AAAAQGGHTTMWDALATAEVHGGARQGIAQFIETVGRVKAALDGGHDIVATTKTLISDIALYDDLRMAAASMSAAQRRIDNVEGLLGSLQRFSERGKGVDALAEYLRHLSLESKDDKEDDNG